VWKKYVRLVVERGDMNCFFCDRLVTPTSNKQLALAVHHIDGDHANDDLGNLAAAHHSCHTTFHKTGQTHTVEAKAKISAAKSGVPIPSLKGRALTEDHRRALSAAHIGGRHSPDTIAKMKASQRRRRLSERVVH
jgi:hypothetical protein